MPAERAAARDRPARSAQKPEVPVSTTRLSKTLLIIGVVMVVVAFLWWQAFFEVVAASIIGERVDVFQYDFLKCLWAFGGDCAVLTDAASAMGVVTYEPVAFWFGAALALLGGVMQATRR
jgi:hypothetical protein